jgi:hypothetical protein
MGPTAVERCPAYIGEGPAAVKRYPALTGGGVAPDRGGSSIVPKVGVERAPALA